MLDEGNSLNMVETPDAPPPEEKSNRTFLIVGGVMAALVFLTLVCMAIYFLVIAPRTSTARSATQTMIAAGNAQAVGQVTLTAQAALWTPTHPVTPVVPLNTPTVMVVKATATSSPTPVIAALNSPAPATATTNPGTLVAIQTQLAANMTMTAAAPLATSGITPQALATTGFFDQGGGLPIMIILALVLVAVIFLSRRMRKSTVK